MPRSGGKRWDQALGESRDEDIDLTLPCTVLSVPKIAAVLLYTLSEIGKGVR